MSTKIEFIFDNPEDPEVFEAGFADGYLDLVRALPAVEKVESAKVWPKEDGSPTPAYRTVDAWFADYDTACAAVTTEAAGVLFPKTFELATGGIRILMSDEETA